jgi:cytochrome bd ubiquinol oxidase subunit I
LQIRYTEPQAFYTLMLGPRSWLFDLVALLYSALIVSGSYYIARALKPALPSHGTGRILLPISVAIAALAGLVFSMPYHLQHVPLVSRVTDVAVNPLGAMQPNKYIAVALLVLFGLLNWIYFVRSFSGPVLWWQTREDPATDRAKPKLLIMLSVCAMLMMLTMGWARETARAWNGYLIYGVMSFTDEAALYQPAPLKSDSATQ